MDLNTLVNESPKVMTVIQAIKSNPEFLDEFKANPQQALTKIGVELNEEELELVQKFGGLGEFEAEVEGIFGKIKAFFASKENPS